MCVCACACVCVCVCVCECEREREREIFNCVCESLLTCCIIFFPFALRRGTLDAGIQVPSAKSAPSTVKNSPSFPTFVVFTLERVTH